TGINVLAGSDYRVLTVSPAEIERGKYNASISILPINNNIIQPEKRTIIIKILGVDNPELGVQVIKEVQINLLDDDCPPTVPKVSIWTATGSVTIQGQSTATGTAEAGAAGICGGTLVVKGKFFGDNNAETSAIIILTQNASAPTRGFASVVRFPLFEGGTRYDYEASGTYDETTKNITLNFTVYDTTDKTQFTGTHVITPK
ncbi:MAG: hypothetical protein K2U26_00425, partial [Cyclobacteriaceae bacterium]|nr:hypothetical protein [Cyclobacteriaceae bacterium]